MTVTKENMWLLFNGRSTEELEKQLKAYNEDLARMVHIDDMEKLMVCKEVIEEILKERENGANAGTN